jgi:hypothetical protein
MYFNIGSIYLILILILQMDVLMEYKNSTPNKEQEKYLSGDPDKPAR